MIKEAQAAVDQLWSEVFATGAATPSVEATTTASSSVATIPPAMADRVKRCRAYIAKMPPAISGEDGSGQTFHVMCTCFRFGLDESEVRTVGREYNARCVPPWSEAELQHKIEDAYAEVSSRGEYGSMLVDRHAPVKTVRNQQGEPAPDAPVLDPADYYSIATTLISDRYCIDGYPALKRHADDWRAWANNHYPVVDDATVRAGVWEYLQRSLKKVVRQKNVEIVPLKPNSNAVNNTLDALRAVANVPGDLTPPLWLDSRNDPPARELLAFKNELVHLATGRTLPHTPLYFNVNALPFDHNPKATCPTWHSFLAQLWPSDPSSIETLKMLCGYFLTRDTHLQKILLIVGPRRAGKGTIARILTALLGPANVAGPTLAGLAGPFGLESLIDKQLAIVSDARLSARADQAAIAERLLAVSGEDALSVPRKHRGDWFGKLAVRFVLMTNELPRLSDPSGAMASRFVVLTLRESFLGREDHTLTDKLLAELPGIANWAMDGWRLLQERGRIDNPESSIEAIRELEDLGSPIGAFVRERCVVAPGRSILADELFGAWRAWCDDQGRDHPGTKQSFGKDLRANVAGLSLTNPLRTQTGRLRFFEGIDLCQE